MIGSRSTSIFTGDDGKAGMLEIKRFAVDGVPGDFERI
tara:strand:- start:448 stop:561 length:114 start_codon:yes stop_codon:yes gene_type:complete